MRSFALRSRSVLVGAALLATTAAVAACAPQEPSTPAATGTTSAATCTKSSLATLASGKLTIATDDPSYPPWIVDNKPDNGQGFESAVAYAVAKQLGFEQSEV